MKKIFRNLLIIVIVIAALLAFFGCNGEYYEVVVEPDRATDKIDISYATDATDVPETTAKPEGTAEPENTDEQYIEIIETTDEGEEGESNATVLPSNETNNGNETNDASGEATPDATAEIPTVTNKAGKATASAKATETSKASGTQSASTKTATPKASATPTAKSSAAATVSSNATATATATTTPKTALVATASPTQTSQRITSAPKTATPTPTPTPTAEVDTSDPCSMVDLTKKALDVENNQKALSAFLTEMASGKTPTTKVATTDLSKLHYTHSYIYWYLTAGKDQSQYVELLDWADDVIEELGITSSTGQKTAAKAINKYVVAYITYDDNSQTDELYNTYTTKLGVCHNYAQLFQLLCHKCGIQCYYEGNDTTMHAYNYIVLSSGEEVYFDCTWNDAKITYKGTVYEVIEAADVIYANLADNVRMKASDGTIFNNKQEFIDYYVLRYFWMTKEDFVAAHALVNSEWSMENAFTRYS